MLGVLTYDGNLLYLEPPEGRRRLSVEGAEPTGTA
jgi:hypothetical protein